MGRGNIAAFTAAALLLVAPMATGESKAKWLPSERQIAALDQASDCSVLESIKLRFQETLRDLREDLNRETGALKAIHASLEQCATEHGLTLGSEDMDKEAEVAARCEPQYENWVQRSYRVLMLEDEQGMNRLKREEAAKHLDHCPRRTPGKVIKSSVMGDLF